MARPRVFVSSTYYDLKHIRTSLEIFIESLGFDAVLSEKGDIAYTPDAPLDESCYREAQNSDIYVLIVGGRYGSEISETRSESSKNFFDRYESITKQEYRSAVEKDIPVYILIDKSVYSEYQTFKKNRDNKKIAYAHVDSVNIFHFIEEILAQTRNNPVHTFDRHSEIEAWLREQWAGLFREFIQRMSSQQQLASLSTQVSELAEINKTLKRYLEALLVSEAPEKSRKLIDTESKRLEEAGKAALIRNNILLQLIHEEENVSYDVIFKALFEARNLQDFLEKIAAFSGADEKQRENILLWGQVEPANKDYETARRTLGLSIIPSAKKILARKGRSSYSATSSEKSVSSNKGKKPVSKKRKSKDSNS